MVPEEQKEKVHVEELSDGFKSLIGQMFREEPAQRYSLVEILSLPYMKDYASPEEVEEFMLKKGQEIREQLRI